MKKLVVYGTGCLKCTQLAEAAQAAAKELGIEYQLEKVTDINKITQAGIMRTPALAVDEQVKVMGRVPSVDELKTIVKDFGRQ